MKSIICLVFVAWAAAVSMPHPEVEYSSSSYPDIWDETVEVLAEDSNYEEIGAGAEMDVEMASGEMEEMAMDAPAIMSYSMENTNLSEPGIAPSNMLYQICPGTCDHGDFINILGSVGQSLVMESEMPWVVSVKPLVPKEMWTKPYNPKHTCTGTILNSRHILTSASCLKYTKYSGINSVVIVTGDLNGVGKSQKQQIIKVSKEIPHPKDAEAYANLEADNIERYNYDIAVLQLESDIEFDETAAPICIAPALSDYTDLEFVIAGYRIHEDMSNYDLVKRNAVGIESGYCGGSLDFSMCAVHDYKPHAGSDFGGPSLVAIDGIWYQVGVSTDLSYTFNVTGVVQSTTTQKIVVDFLPFIKGAIEGGYCQDPATV